MNTDTPPRDSDEPHPRPLASDSRPQAGHDADRRRKRRHTFVAWSVVGALSVVAIFLAVWIRGSRARIAEERGKARRGEKPPTDVSVQVLAKVELVDDMRLPGIVSAWDAVWVAAEVSGVVVAVAVDEGRDVFKGDVLCRLDDRDHRAALDGATAVLGAAEVGLQSAELHFMRTRQLTSEGAVNQAQYDSAEAAARQALNGVKQAKAGVARARLALERTVVRAPMTGIISKVVPTVGSFLSRGKPVFRIVDIRRVRVSVGIPEKDVVAVRNLKRVELTVGSVPERRFVGARAYLAVEPEQRAHTYTMELAVENPERMLQPGMFATAKVVKDVRQVIMIPLVSVIPREEDRIVFVEENGRARRRVVQLGLIRGRKLWEAEVEITKGLAPGDRLIVVGQRQIEEDDRVRVVEAARGLLRTENTSP